MSNKLSNRYSEYPSWIGTLEIIEDGKRMVYSHIWKSDGKGGGTATYKKKIYGGQIVEENIIKGECDQYTLIKGK